MNTKTFEVQTCMTCGEDRPKEDFLRQDGTYGGACRACTMMFALSREKRERGLGSGGIKSKNKDGRYLDMDIEQEWWLVADDAQPIYEWTGFTKDGEPVSMNEQDLMRRAMSRVRHTLNRKGFVDIPHQDVEDAAADVVCEFLERMEDFESEPIRDPNAYLWRLCTIKAQQRMQAWVQMQRDLAEPIDVMMQRGFDVEDVEQPEQHDVPWTKLTDEQLDPVLSGAGLTVAEFKTLVGALRGTNKGMKGRDSTRRKLRSAVSKLSNNNEDVYKEFMQVIS